MTADLDSQSTAKRRTTMQIFRRLPLEVEAIQWLPSNEISDEVKSWAQAATAIIDSDHIQHLWNDDAGGYVMPSGKTVTAPHGQRCLIIVTLDTEMVVNPGDWIIRGVQGEFYPCKDEIFQATYSPEDAPAGPSPS